ncbi:PepSY-associated TM helix domain-containing protein [Asticcacaulis sp. 201]|uniref:PepSY-associated TM helix domain-containing protein n=1 Tax=Asticcacaulis sp. 201 TaxID=3028787 RepID=UPI002916DE4C|nr:PepSY-associated TM helix domain-containing protein [Asticcacaulis sp. 201]MDV6330255.1 PepSY-associated TM helix domain-containing protein [Asticcacaulis sp. 201]
MSLSSSPSPIQWGSFWRNQLRQWHWISSAVSLIGLLLFAVTGFTLNHAASIEAKPKITSVAKRLPLDALAKLSGVTANTPLTAVQAEAIRGATGIDVRNATVDADEEGIYLALPEPGVDSTLEIARADGRATYERTDRGVIAVLNDLHKGRHSGPVWSLFIDVIAIACVVFAVTGLGLLWLYEKGRRITWPLVTLGLVVPVILFLLFVHA